MRARAVWLSAARTVELREEQAPPPGPGELRARAIVSGISHGTERLVYRGEVSPELPLDLPTLAGGYGFPIKFGYAIVGEVLECGPGVTRAAPGDRVFALHPHQSIFTVPEQLALRLPAGLPEERGVFAANLETALTIVHDSPLRLGESALLIGQGVVGLLLTQLCRMAGARALVVEPLAWRRELALQLGADAALEPGPDLAERVRAANGGRLADVAFEVSGSPAALQSAIDGVLDEGTVVVASWYGVKPVTLSLGERFHRGRIRLRSSQVGRLSPEHGPRWDYARRSEAVAGLLPRLRLAELITHRLPLAQADAAYRLLDAGAGPIGQIVLSYAEERLADV